MPYVIRRWDGLYVPTRPAYRSVIHEGASTLHPDKARHFKTVSGAKAWIRANPNLAGNLFTTPSILKVN